MAYSKRKKAGGRGDRNDATQTKKNYKAPTSGYDDILYSHGSAGDVAAFGRKELRLAKTL